MKQDEIAKKQFKQYGIDTEPPNRLKQLAVTSTFASLQLAGNLVRMNSKSDPLADLLGNKNQNDNIQNRITR